ncbi:hypothetical protein [Streptomyces achromogenes]|uniref:hypothetical protein n=1 Tax=Streptomyces achromogenes TaxID=67255 RepID=UPI003A807B74
MTYSERMYGLQGPPAETEQIQQAGHEVLGAINAYRAEDETEALRLFFWLRNQAEMNVMMGIGRQLAMGKSWDDIAGMLGMDRTEAVERWGGIGFVPQDSTAR